MPRGGAWLACIVATSLQTGNLIAGQPDRVVQEFDGAGKLIGETQYRNGQKNGRFVSFWPDGRPRVRAFYEGDRIEGDYRSWHANGRLAEWKRYQEGRQVGLQQAWTDRGELYLNFEVRNGRHYGLVNSKPCLPVSADPKGASPGSAM